MNSRFRVVLTVTVPVVIAMGVGTPAVAQETGQECVLLCETDWFTCEGPEDHYAFWPQSSHAWNMYGSGAHKDGECFPSSCSVEHPECVAHLDLVDTTERAVRAADVDALRKVLAEYPDIVAVNEGRSAFQFHGCNGDLLGHVPVEPELLARLPEQS